MIVIFNKDILREKRQEKGLSQEELAKKVGVSRQTISQYERGKTVPPIDIGCALINELELDITDIITQSILDFIPSNNTYSSAMEHFLSLQQSGLFEFIDYSPKGEMCLYLVTKDQFFIEFYQQVSRLTNAKSEIPKETFDLLLKNLFKSYNLIITNIKDDEIFCDSDNETDDDKIDEN